MSNRELRGTKRICQNPECGVKFYDLMHDPITCPACGAAYQPMVAPLVAESSRAEARKPAKKPEIVAEDAAPTSDSSDVESVSLDDLAAEEEAVAGDDDETFLEEEEDEGSDVSGIIGGPGEGDDDQ